jgi:hypothetical protein
MYSSHSIASVTCLRLSSRWISAQSGSVWRRWPCLVPAAVKISVHPALGQDPHTLRPRRVAPKPGQTHEPKGLVEVRQWITSALASSGLVLASSAVSVISAGNGQSNPALASRFKVNRIVDGATPTRRAISLSPTPAVLKRSTSRTWRIAVLFAGIRSPVQKPKERTLIGPAEAPPTRATSSRNAGRHHPGMPGDIILERRARSNRNAGRDHRGFASDFPRNPQ